MLPFLSKSRAHVVEVCLHHEGEGVHTHLTVHIHGCAKAHRGQIRKNFYFVPERFLSVVNPQSLVSVNGATLILAPFDNGFKKILYHCHPSLYIASP